jgi:SRSO17 transposase
MEQRFAVRFEQMMAQAEMKPDILKGALERLEQFIQPFVACLEHPVQKKHAVEYMVGLASNIPRKNVEMIAYLYEHDRQPLQKFIGQKPWDEKPMIDTLVKQVAEAIGRSDGVIVFDPSAMRKQGKESVGTARQYCGRYGKVDNCQVAVYCAYVSQAEHALVDTRLYLPEEWTKDKRRCRRAGVPKEEMKFRTRHELALEMLRKHRDVLPHAWVTGDDEMGKSSGFRDDLTAMEEQYLLCVPSNTLVRDLDAKPPPYRGSGRRPVVPYQHAECWAKSVPRWEKIEVRSGEKGPLIVEAAKCRVQTKRAQCNGPEETLVVFRVQQGQESFKHDYCLSNASFDTPLKEFARVLDAEHRIEECLRRAKSEAGLGSYQVRKWMGWHHHQALTLIATWFLTQEKRRGEKSIALSVGTASAFHHWPIAGREVSHQHTVAYSLANQPNQPSPGRGSLLPLEKT